MRETVTRGHLEPRARDAAAPAASRASSPVALVGVLAGVELDLRGADAERARSICASSAAMKRLTLMPAPRTSAACAPPAPRPRQRRRARPRSCAPRRRSGTSVHTSGFTRKRDRDHLVGRRHLEVERAARQAQTSDSAHDVVVDDVPAVLAQVRGDAVGARGEALLRAASGIRIRASRARCGAVATWSTLMWSRTAACARLSRRPPKPSR